MMKMFMLGILVSQIAPTSAQERQITAKTQEELSPSLISERLAQVSTEGLGVIERVKMMMPEIQKHQSAKTLGQAVEDCVAGHCESIIYPLGWEAIKSEGSQWKIFFYFKDGAGRYLKAAWDYYDAKSSLIPAEFTNATKFWVMRTKNFRP